MKIVSIIPIKLNNERLPGKNTRLLNGKPLISYVEESLLACAKIKEKYVFCSDEKVCEYLLPGIRFLKRSKELDLPTSNFTQIFSAFMEIIYADIYVYAHATAPFISVDTINECIDKVVSQQYDSAFCAQKIQDFLWVDGAPLNFDAAHLPRSQDLKPIYRETSGVYVFTKDVFLKYRRRIGSHPFIKEVTFKESVDINTMEDFKLAELVCTSNIE